MKGFYIKTKQVLHKDICSERCGCRYLSPVKIISMLLDFPTALISL